MALDATTSKAIANALADGKTYTFPTPYLGLFTTMPGSGGTGGKELNYPEYCRVDLMAKGIEGQVILGEAATEEGTGNDADKLVAYVKNQERIYFPDVQFKKVETVDGVEIEGTMEEGHSYQEQVIGVGLFSSKKATTPYLWGEFPEGSEPVLVKLNSVPMIRINNLKLTAK